MALGCTDTHFLLWKGLNYGLLIFCTVSVQFNFYTQVAENILFFFRGVCPHGTKIKSSYLTFCYVTILNICKSSQYKLHIIHHE